MATFLEQKTTKELQVLAKTAGISGWHKMRKVELIDALGALDTSSEKKKPLKTLQEKKIPIVLENLSREGASSTEKSDLKISDNKKPENHLPVRKKASAAKPYGETEQKDVLKKKIDKISSSEKENKAVPLKNPPKKKVAIKIPVQENMTEKHISDEKKPILETPLETSKPRRKKASVPSSLISGKREKKNVLKEKILSEKSQSKMSSSEKTTPENLLTEQSQSEQSQSEKSQSEKSQTEKSSVEKKRPEKESCDKVKTEVKSVEVIAKIQKEIEKTQQTANSESALFEEKHGIGITSPVAQIPIKKNSSLLPPQSEKPLDEVQQRIQLLKEKLMLHKTLCSPVSSGGREAKDQLILMVRDPFWLHAYWEISAPLVERIRAAMGHLWHTADPILRLYKVHSDNVGALRQEFITDIQIHGGINNWYIDVDDPPSQFLVEIGYLARDGQFFVLLSSNIVETPQRYIHDAFGHPDVSWMGIPPDFCSGVFSDSLNKGDFKNGQSGPESSAPLVSDETRIIPNAVRDFSLAVDSEIVIKGKTDPGVQLSIKGEKIRLKEDGSFSIRYHLPERRHVFPVVAVSADGMETQTVILAFERNTKVLETVIKDEEIE